MIKTFVVIIVCIYSVNAYEKLKLKNPSTKYGFVHPNRAELNGNVSYVLEGVDVLIYLEKIPENYAACKLSTPNAEITYSLVKNGDDDSSKVEFWNPNSKTSGCGARIKNVTVSDSGRWRLQAVNDEEDHLYQSFINLKVIKNFDRPNGDFIVREGTNDEFDMTNYASYCEISNPKLIENQNIFDQCRVDLENINKLYSGKWVAKVGVLGKIDEIVLQPNVEVVGERFDVGHNKSGSKINIFCNLKNAVNTNVSFCRFIKSGNDVGLRLSEGLSNGRYSYFGHVLRDGDCGLTIENPQMTDYTTWKCTLGIHRQIGKNKTYEIKESIISVAKFSKRSVRSVENKLKDVPEVLAALGHNLNINFKTDFPIKYCIIKHPNGTQYGFNKQFNNNNWTTVGNLRLGQCGMQIFQTSYNESGTWKMQIGHEETRFMDLVVKIPVRVFEKAIAPLVETLVAEEDSQLTLRCKAIANEPNILEYCRFSLPNGNGFQIDEKVTEDEAIDDLYWYNGTSLKHGDCQVTIKNIKSEHFGKWYCSGKILGSESLEDYASINIETDELSIASISAIAGGSALAVILAGGGIIYYIRRKRRQPQRRQTYLTSSSRSSQSDTVFERNAPLVSAEEIQQQPERVVEEIEMSDITHSESRYSVNVSEHEASTSPGSSI